MPLLRSTFPIFLCFTLAAAGLVGAERPVLFEATDLDGVTVRGEWLSLDPEQIVLQGDGSQHRVSPNRLAVLRSLADSPFRSGKRVADRAPSGSGNRTFSPSRSTPGVRPASPRSENTAGGTDPAQTGFPTPAVVVELRDGTRLVGDTLTLKGSAVRCRLPDGGETTFPPSRLAGVRWNVAKPEEVAEVPADWSALFAAPNVPGDRLVVGRPGALDVYGGVVLEIGDETVSFSVDGETLPVPRRRVFGLIFHAAAEDAPNANAAPSGRLLLWNGSRIPLRDLRYDAEKGRLDWTAPAGFSGSTDLRDVERIDFGRNDQMLLLSALEPIAVEQTPPFAWERPVPDPRADRTGPIEMMRRFRLRRLRQGVPQDAAAVPTPPVRMLPGDVRHAALPNRPIPGLEGIELDGACYRHGLLIPVGTKIVYRLPEPYSVLRAEAGIDDRLRPNGRARLLVEADGQLLGDFVLRGDEAARSLKLDLPAHTTTLALSVAFVDAVTDSTPLSLAECNLTK